MKSKVLKKIMVVSPYFPPHIGGVEFYVQNMAHALKKFYNADVVIVTSNLESKKIIVEKQDGIKIYKLPILFKLSNTPVNPFWYFQIKKIVQTEKPDIINAHTPVPIMADIASLAKGNIPLVVTSHALTLFKGNGKISLFNIIAGIYGKIGSQTFNRANALIVIVNAIKKTLPASLQDKTTVVNNSIWKKDIKNKIKLSDKKRLVFIGSLEKTHSWKGLSQIIDAVSMYVDKYDRNIKLLVVGDGNGKQAYINKVKSLNAASYIHFEGAKFGQGKKNILKDASLLISYPTTSNDAFPTVFLEAWGSGIPVISADISPINTIIRHEENGYLVKPDSPKALAKAIKTLLEDTSLRKRIMENAYDTMTQENLWESNIRRIHKVFVSSLN